MLAAVDSFAALYVNNPAERTGGRDAAITLAAERYLKKVKSCNCPDWHLDTLMELMHLIKKLKMTDYLMRAGALLYQFSRTDLTTTIHNIDNDRAELFLGLDSRKLELFEEYPRDEAGNWVGITEARFNELCEKFKVNPASRFEESQAFTVNTVSPDEVAAEQTTVIEEPKSLTELEQAIEKASANIVVDEDLAELTGEIVPTTSKKQSKGKK